VKRSGVTPPYVLLHLAEAPPEEWKVCHGAVLHGGVGRVEGVIDVRRFSGGRGWAGREEGEEGVWGCDGVAVITVTAFFTVCGFGAWCAYG
jgi:hypothetical protein